MELYPAIDLRGGRCVRLLRGDYEAETDYGGDPVRQALQFAEAGAAWIHVVDLDAARTGDPVNLPVIASIAAAVNAQVQAGGGVRSAAAAAALADVGVARVVLGTAAVETPELVTQVAARQPVAVGLDARGRQVATHGWERHGEADLLELARRFESSGAEAAVVTEIDVDGTLAGPDTTGLADVLGTTSLAVIASGGVSSLEDLRTLARMRVAGRHLAGVVVGRALYEQRFTVAEALQTIHALETQQTADETAETSQ